MLRRIAGSLVLVYLGASSVYAQRTQQSPALVGPASLSTTTCPGAGCVNLDVAGQGTIGVQVTGSWVGTLTFNGSADGATFQTLNCTPTNGTTQVTSTTANGLWVCSVAGLRLSQLAFTAYTSGSAVVTIQAAPTGGGSGGGGGGGGSDVTIHDPGTPTQKVAVNASGQMSITCANCSGSGASAVDRSAWTFGTTSLAPGGGVFDDTPPADLTTGMVGAFRQTPKRGIHVNFRTNAGVEVPFPAALGANGGFKIEGVASGTAVPVSGTVALSNSFLLDATYTGRMPAGASPADAESNTNTALSRIGAFHYVYNGTTWDRARGDTTNGAFVNVKTSVLPTGASTEATLLSLKTDNDPFVVSNAGGYVRQDSTATIAKESGGNLATVKTNTDPLVAAGGGGYVRQDSTATIAKETGGNLATVKTNTDPLVASAAGGYVRQDSTATIAKETGGNLATVKTNTDPLVASGGGGYVRQDSTATIAKETGGNLATIATNTTGVATAANQATEVSSLSSIDSKLSATANGNNDTALLAILRALLQQGTPKTAVGLKGSFGRMVTSTNDALNVYLQNPVDPCAGAMKMNVAISQTASTRLLTAAPGRVYVCSALVVGADAESISLVEGTGTTCGTATAGIIGGTTAAAGPNLAANSGFLAGAGTGTIAVSNTPGNDVCLLQSGAGRVAGNLTIAIVR